MSRSPSKAFKVSLVALMLALTILFELLARALPISVPWGMHVDLVAIPVMVVFFALGTRYGILTTFGMLALLYVFGTELPIGPVMKFVATLPMVLVLGIFLLPPFKNGGLAGQAFKSPLRFAGIGAMAIAARCAVALVVNYYWAIPFYLNMPIDQVVQQSFGWLWVFLVQITGLNLIQGIIDLTLSWVIIFKFGIANRYLAGMKKPLTGALQPPRVQGDF